QPAARQPRQALEDVRVDLQAVAGADLGQPRGDVGDPNAAEVEALAAADDGGRNLVGLGGAEDEDGVGRRLFQRFQEGVPGGGGQLVRLVDDVDAEARLVWGVADPLSKLADVVDAAIAGGVDLHQVERGAGEAGAAEGAGVAGLAVLGVEAVERAEQDAGQAGLTGAARPG